MTLHVLDGAVDESSWQTLCSTTKPRQVLPPGLSLGRWPCLLLAPHATANFLPERVVAHVQLRTPLRNAEGVLGRQQPNDYATE